MKSFLNTLIDVLSEQHENYNIHKRDDNPFTAEFFQKLTPSNATEEEKGSVNDYTYDSRKINKDLWSTNGNNHKDIIDKISSYIDKAPAAPEDFHVYTGINGKKNETKGFIHIPAFTSTSSDIHVAAKFVSPAKNRHTVEYRNDINGDKVLHTIHHILKIHVKKGQKVGAYVAPHSDMPTEKEFLINKGHTITIGNHVDIKNAYDPTTIYRIHHATINMHDE